MKKVLVFIFTLMMCITLIACAPREGSKNYENNANLTAVNGYKNLYYDSSTKIVYLIFNEGIGDKGYGYMSPYYAPNGLPYLYDTNNQVLIEIDNCTYEKCGCASIAKKLKQETNNG